jgi:DNA/RNA-binding domain of Phe-tRNA-synthetase-like protein
MIDIDVEGYEPLELIFLETHLPKPLGELETPPDVMSLFDLEADTPLSVDDHVKTTVRDAFRHGGFKPKGRDKPAAEFLVKAVQKGWISPDEGINLAVDILNAVSLHSGLPISVIDADLLQPPLRIAICEGECEYVFNPSGHTIDVTGLVTLFDAEGPSGGPVKDSQRTKTHDGTVRTLSIVWGTSELEGRTQKTAEWYKELLEESGARVEMWRP